MVWIFKTKFCCCGISLETGSIVIVILNLILGSYGIENAFTSHSSVTINGEVIDEKNGGFGFQYLIYLGIEVTCLYGIIQKKPLLLLPHLVLHAVSIILTIIALIFVLTALILFKYWIIKFFEDQFGAPFAFYIIFILLLVLCIVCLLVQYHFFNVVFSYYLLLKIETTTGLRQGEVIVA